MQPIWDVLAQVPDPEIPAVSVVELGIVRDVSEKRVVITPTYSGCPATLFIEQSIRAALDAAHETALASVRRDLVPLRDAALVVWKPAPRRS